MRQLPRQRPDQLEHGLRDLEQHPDTMQSITGWDWIITIIMNGELELRLTRQNVSWAAAHSGKLIDGDFRESKLTERPQRLKQ